MEFLFQYGLFVAKAITIVVAILLAVGGIIVLSSKQKQGAGQLEIKSMSEQFEELKEHAQHLILSKEQLKKKQKEQKKADKEAKKKDKDEVKANLFVVDFKGSMDAHEVDSLREEITAILCAAQPKDEVLVRLESGGGVVHGYGLAASQLQRLKDKNIHLTAAVDKVAASGGYMMACVADHVLSAKFAIIGSIGVIAQLPNFNKVLKKNDIEFEQHTAGDFKRTLTLFGENTDQGRDKFKQELEEVHVMFKDFVSSNRADLDIDKVATGEYWYGSRAKELGLVDTIQTSDDFLMSKLDSRNIFSVKYSKKKGLAEKFGKAASTGIESALVKLWSKSQTLFK
ncbi:protease SohB [Aliiglaciecola sp. SL4]|uniref:protease SohB n=1 Tax=Aliiglaciecola sp. SL4 TaxID=3239806 RepID=UPI00355B3E68